MTELKPCPFCGSKNVHTNKDIYGHWIVECWERGCRASYGNHKYPYTTEQDAIDGWNRRVKEMSDKNGFMRLSTEPRECEAKEIAEGVADLYLCGESDCFIGIRAKDIPELKRLFAQSESEDIRKMVEFLEGVEADIWPKEVKG